MISVGNYNKQKHTFTTHKFDITYDAGIITNDYVLQKSKS